MHAATLSRAKVIDIVTEWGTTLFEMLWVATSCTPMWQIWAGNVDFSHRCKDTHQLDPPLPTFRESLVMIRKTPKHGHCH